MNSNSIIKQQTVSYQLFQFLTNPCSYSYSLLRHCSFSNVIKISSSQQKHINSQELLNFYKKIGKTTKKLFYEWLSLLIFNVCALNQQHYDQVQKYILQSTSADLNYSEKNTKITQQAISLLKLNMKKWFETFFNSEIIQKIIETDDNSNYQLSILYETIDYVLIKYQLRMQKQLKLIQRIQNCLKVKQPKSDIVKAFNMMIFSEELHELLETNYNINDANIIKLINANYSIKSYQRPIFKSARLTGKETIEHLIYILIRKKTSDISKLFSKDYEKVNRIYKFFMDWVWNRFAYISIYFYQKFISNFIQQIEEKANLIGNYFNSILYEEHEFQSILHKIYSALCLKANQQIALQLMKKFILNRFFLNVEHIISNYVDCYDNEAYINQVISSANKIRLLFYEQKNERTLRQPSMKIIKSLTRLITTSSQQHKGIISSSTSQIYIPDKILFLCYHQLAIQLNNEQSLSLSFSLLKNQDISQNLSNGLPVDSHSKISPHFFQSPRTQLSYIEEKQATIKSMSKRSYKEKSGLNNNLNNQPQTSLRSFLKHWQKEQPLSNPQLHQKQTRNATQIANQTEDKLQIMIQNRRQHGVLKQLIFDRSCQKLQRWKVKSMHFKKQINQMRDWRKQLEKSSNQMKLEIQLL